MRVFKNTQKKIGEINIAEIKLDKKSKDDIPRLLLGLQHLYSDKEVREKVMEILMTKLLPKVDKGNGRKGMEMWNIFVLHVLKTGANLDYCRLREYANSHREVRAFLGLSFMLEDGAFDLQTIKNNVGVMTDEIMREINVEVVKQGHKLVSEKNKKKLKVRGDSFVVKTNVEYPTDIGLLEDAIVTSIRDISEMANKYDLRGWRESESAIKKIQKLKFAAQQSRRAKDKKSEKQDNKPHRKLINYANKIIIKYKNDIIKISGKIEQALEKTSIGADTKGAAKKENIKKDIDKVEKINFFIQEGERQLQQMERRIFNGEVIPNNEKIFSLFKPWTEWIVKGKAGVPFELGVRVAVMEDHNGFILNHRIMYNETDEKIAVEFLKDTISLFPNIESISYDRGFWNKENLEEITKLVSNVGLPKKGKLTQDDKKRQSSDEYKYARDKHSAIESAINALQHHGLDFCPDYSKQKFGNHISASIVSRNLIKTGDILITKQQKSLKRKKYTFAYDHLEKAA